MRFNVVWIAIWVISIVPLITFATTYALAFTRNDFPLHDAVPFLSLSISLPPESCIGTFGLVITANAASVLMVAKRYMQLVSFARIAPSRLSVRHCQTSLFVFAHAPRFRVPKNGSMAHCLSD